MPRLRPRRPTKPYASAARLFRRHLPHLGRTPEVVLEGQEDEADVRVALRELDDLVVTSADLEAQRAERIVHAQRQRRLVAVQLLAQRDIARVLGLEAAFLDRY